VSASDLRVTAEPPLIHVVFQRPPENALTLPLVSDLASAVTRVDQDPLVRVAILSGAGNTFCGGTDLRGLESLDPKPFLAAAQLGQDVALRIERSEKIWIAAVEGVARGGGFDLALACDLLVASEFARFESPEVGEGWIPFFGGTQRIRHALGRARAREVILAGTPVTAADGHAIGFVNRVTPPGGAMAGAEELAQTIAARPWPSVRAAKRVLVEQLDKPYRNGFLLEAQFLASLLAQRKSKP